ncbi:MAG: Holliday junction resolvase RuvX [Patescibacteria group bacterium]
MSKTNILALDVGTKRVGVALARAAVRVPVALETLDRQSPDFWDQLKKLTTEHGISQLIVGLPRGLNGQETAQTRDVITFAERLKKQIALPIVWQDEALTSVKAESVLNNGKPYQKSQVDALAACFILADYLEGEEVALL